MQQLAVAADENQVLRLAGQLNRPDDLIALLQRDDFELVPGLRVIRQNALDHASSGAERQPCRSRVQRRQPHHGLAGFQ